MGKAVAGSKAGWDEKKKTGYIYDGTHWVQFKKGKRTGRKEKHRISTTELRGLGIGTLAKRIKNSPKRWANRLKIGKKAVKENNPFNEQNKKIKEKKANITKENAGRTKSQIAALKRKRDGLKISDVQAANKARMQQAAKDRHKKFKETGKSTYEERQAKRKKDMQAAAKKRNEKFQNDRKLKIKQKENEKKKKENEKKKKKNVKEVINKTKKYNDDKYNFTTM